MSPVEFLYWQAYDIIDPYGEERADWRAGMIASTNINLHISKNADPVKIADLMWKYKDPEEQEIEEEPDPERLAARLEAAFSAFLGPNPYELQPTNPS